MFTMIASVGRLRIRQERLAHTRTSHVSTTSTSRPPRVSRSSLPPDADIEEAIRVGSRLAGRDLPTALLAELTTKLKANWYENARDISLMSDDESISIGLPLKLKNTIASALADERIAQEGGREVDWDGEGVIDDDDDDDDDDESPSTSTSASTDVYVSSTAETTEDDMEQSICPPFDRFGFSIADVPKVVARRKIDKYALNKEELTPDLRAELDRLFKFGTERFYGAQADPIAAVTAAKYEDHIRGMLGYTVNVLGEDINSVSLKTLVPSAERDGVIPAFNYAQWLVKERQIAVRTELLVLRSILYASKFLYHDQSQIVLGSGDKPYADIPVCKEIRALINSRRKASKVAPRVSDEAAKWLDFPEYLAMTRELKRETGCLKETSKGDVVRRDDKQIAWSLQKYLIFGILACVPDRQRTIRELELGRTLFKDEEAGIYVIKHKPSDYKTGKAYGERAPLYISQSLTAALDVFLGRYRAALEPEHEFLFTQANGAPLTDKSLCVLTSTDVRSLFARPDSLTRATRFARSLVRQVQSILDDGVSSEREARVAALRAGYRGDASAIVRDCQRARPRGARGLHGTQPVDSEVDVRPPFAQRESRSRSETLGEPPATAAVAGPGGHLQASTGAVDHTFYISPLNGSKRVRCGGLRRHGLHRKTRV